jgi:hypothetical protein
MRLWGRKEEPVDPQAVKERSMAEVRRLGGKTLDGLPIIEMTTARSGEALAARALVLNALVGYAYDAPASLIREWIVANGLTQSLSAAETALLRKETEELAEQERIDLSWSPEAICALMWAGGLLDGLPLGEEIPMEAFAPLPKVGQGESGQRFAGRVRLRPYAELYAMRDFYYRAHWFARDGGLNGYDTGVFVSGIIVERRKALEWLLDDTTDWDELDLST